MQLLVVLLAACASLRTAALIPAGTGAVPHALLPAAPTRWPRPLPWRAPVLRCGTVAESGGRLRGRGVALSGRSDPDAVTELLGLVAPGLEGNYSAAQRRRIDDLLDKLDAAGSGDTFLEAPSLRDFYRVQFTRDAARGTPVGGGFRYSALGRALFKTDDALQHVIDDQVVNMLFFRFLGIFPGGVVLRGTLARCPADERRAIEQKYSTPPPGLSSETIKVLFDQPRVFFGASGVLNFEVGPNTTVYLDTTYLDDRVRIGRNRFGGHFVFTRLSAAEKMPGSAADSWRSLLARPKVPLAAAGVYLVAAIAGIARPQMLPEGVWRAQASRRLAAAALAVLLPLVLLFICTFLP